MQLVYLIMFTAISGCAWNLGPWGGPAYMLDLNRVGSGEQAIQPRNDDANWHGQPVNLRTRR